MDNLNDAQLGRAVREVTGVGPAPRSPTPTNGGTMITWSKLIPIFVLLAGLGGGAVLTSALASDSAAEAKATAARKMNTELAKAEFAPRDAVVRIQADVEHLKRQAEKQSVKLDKILEAVSRRRR